MIPSGSIHLTSRRVLLIENSPGDRKLLRTWLNTEMIDTFEAVDIMTGLAACQKYVPNLILLQLRLNTWDGFEVIRRLKEDPRTRSIPVIFLANSALTAEKAKGIDMGAVDFVSQPYDSVELLARVHSALRTKALLDLLEQRAHLDGLTELGNRFALQQMLPQEIETCIQANAPLSLVIADLDHFKKVNDQYGHAAGDEILRRFAVILRHAARETDFLARYGGEEFVVLCPNCDLATALDTAERIRMGVAEHPVAFRNTTIRVTASLGVLSTSNLVGEDPRTLVDRADQALYRAKSAGRNAVWIWDSELGAPVASSTTGIPIAVDGTPISPIVEAESIESTPEPSATVDRRAAPPQPRPPCPTGAEPFRDGSSAELEALSRDEIIARAGPKLGAVRQALIPPELDRRSPSAPEPIVLADPLPAMASLEPDPRPIPRGRPVTWGTVKAADTSSMCASSSEIEALWGIDKELSSETTRPSSPNSLQHAAAAKLSPLPTSTRVDQGAPKKPTAPPRRIGNGPPPPPPNPRLGAEIPAKAGPKTD